MELMWVCDVNEDCPNWGMAWMKGVKVGWLNGLNDDGDDEVEDDDAAE